jgi:hypothetical protein
VKIFTSRTSSEGGWVSLSRRPRILVWNVNTVNNDFVSNFHFTNMSTDLWVLFQAGYLFWNAFSFFVRLFIHDVPHRFVSVLWLFWFMNGVWRKMIRDLKNRSEVLFSFTDYLFITRYTLALFGVAFYEYFKEE